MLMSKLVSKSIMHLYHVRLTSLFLLTDVICVSPMDSPDLLINNVDIYKEWLVVLLLSVFKFLKIYV